MGRKKFVVQRADSIEFDKSIVLTEQELKALPFGFQSNFRETGWKNLRAGKTEAAIRDFHMSAAVVAEDPRVLIGRAHARVKNGLFGGALKDAETVLRQNEYDRNAIFLQALCESELGNMEQGLVMYNRGINKRGYRKEFCDGKMAVEASIENCVGRFAGQMLRDLAPTIHAMKAREKWLKEKEAEAKPPCEDNLYQPIVHDCSEDEYNRAQRRKQTREAKLSDVYLGKLSEDLHWCKDLSNKISVGPLAKSTNRILQMADAAARELCTLQEILVARKPLYHLRHMFTPCKKVATRYRESNEKVMEVITNDDLKRMFDNLKMLREKGQTKDCCVQADRIHNLLLKNKWIPKKKEYLANLCELMGKIYLDRLTLSATCSQKENKLRVLHLLGLVPKINKTLQSSFVHESSFPFWDPKSWTEIYQEELKVADNELERAFLHHQLARLYSMRNKPDHAIMEAMKCVQSSIECKSNEWAVNGLFLIVSQNKSPETLCECIQYAKKLDDEDVITFLMLAKTVLKGRTKRHMAESEDPIEQRGIQLVKLIEDGTTKAKVRAMLIRNKKK